MLLSQAFGPNGLERWTAQADGTGLYERFDAADTLLESRAFDAEEAVRFRTQLKAVEILTTAQDQLDGLQAEWEGAAKTTANAVTAITRLFQIAQGQLDLTKKLAKVTLGSPDRSM